MAPYRHSRQYSLPRSRHTVVGMRLWWAWRHPSEPASAWASPRPCLTTAASLGAVILGAAGVICGLMTALGGIGHTLPFLIPDFRVAMTAAMLAVVIELGIISWVRHRYMETPVVSAVLQVGLGGILVFITGVLIGKRVISRGARTSAWPRRDFLDASLYVRKIHKQASR